MYIMITSRCNMACAHCCNSCRPGRGTDMSFDVFSRAIALETDYGGECTSLGGGEPTIHPQFWQFLGYAIGHVTDVWLATNGKVTDTALCLAKLARKGVISCALSQDPWHEPIDPKVVAAFGDPKRPGDGHNDYREVRNVGKAGLPMAAGRASKWGKEGCVCEDVLVRPDGTIRQCGCRNSPKIGDVWRGFEPLGGDSLRCYKLARQEELAEKARQLTEVGGVKL